LRKSLCLRYGHRPPLSFAGPFAIFSAALLLTIGVVIVGVGLSSSRAHGGLGRMFRIHRKWTRRAGPEPEVFLFRWRCGRGLGVLIARFCGGEARGIYPYPSPVPRGVGLIWSGLVRSGQVRSGQVRQNVRLSAESPDFSPRKGPCHDRGLTEDSVEDCGR
jgi:hypothetical protein